MPGELKKDLVSIGLDMNEGTVVVSFENHDQSLRMDVNSALSLACGIATAAITGGADPEIMAREMGLGRERAIRTTAPPTGRLDA